MELQSTLEHAALQLKNGPRMLVSVAAVVQQIMKTLYETHFPDAEHRRPGQNPDCPDSDMLTIGGLLAYIGADSEHSGYRRLKVGGFSVNNDKVEIPRHPFISSAFNYRPV